MPPFLLLNQIAIKTKTAGYWIKSFFKYGNMDPF